MNNIIKKLLILLSLNLLLPTTNLFGDTLDSIEIKTTALIFSEHQKLLIENSLFKNQISSLEELNKLYVISDSLQKEEIKIYEDKVASDDKKIKKLKSTQKKIIIGSSVGGIVLLIIGLLI